MIWEWTSRLTRLEMNMQMGVLPLSEKAVSKLVLRNRPDGKNKMFLQGENNHLLSGQDPLPQPFHSGRALRLSSNAQDHQWTFPAQFLTQRMSNPSSSMGDEDGQGRLRCALELGFYLPAHLSWATPPLSLPSLGQDLRPGDPEEWPGCLLYMHWGCACTDRELGESFSFLLIQTDSAGGRKELEILWQFTKTWSYDKEITVQGSPILLPLSLLYERHERNEYCDRVMTLLIKPAY